MVEPWIFLLMKILILLLLYYFIFRVVIVIVRDIKDQTSEEVGLGKGMGQQVSGGSLGLMVVKSKVGEIKKGARFPISKDISIGRDPRNAITINDSFISNEHARVQNVNGRIYIEDLDSKNGTLVNGTRFRDSVSLEEGDLVQLGGVTFKVVRWKYAGS